MTKIILDHDAFMRRLHRQNKDSEWARDIRSYEFWKKQADLYGTEYAIQRVKELKAKYPGKLD